ncbi:DNA polymerase [Actinomadura luteofluorescens]|uniref:Type-4 uracil-DNA glycosylase n=2 Tax=Actinomadura luteofluorescens TaxID=46163 RepID=A0A7Y9EGH4_9ACTN|nr:UdgX family uracil-DNA binding protein [Actinomadura luteofluorescens]NYD47086.1 DNA polymerase [Actinomadura luteofluorescens]
MNAKPSPDAEPFLPGTPEERADLEALRRAAADCRGCGLYRDATRTVFGEGSPDGRMLLIGEQPGDQEDRAGRPFVGPAGRVLDRALEEAGIERGDVYVTNAVKHFKFKRQVGGKRRIHEPPNAGEMRACRPWLLAELRLLDPAVVVALGATAGRALLGSSFRVTRQRGRLLPMPGLETIGTPAAAREIADEPPGEGVARLLATIHPSAVLRAEDREVVYQGLLDDLRIAASALG